MSVSERRDNNHARGSADFFRNVLASLPAQVAVLDSEGRIVEVNEAWRRFARENGGGASTLAPEGMNYLEVCERSPALGEIQALSTLDGIRGVLSGERDSFDFEYPCHSADSHRWFIMRVRSLGRGAGAVVTHDEITRRKKTEEALRSSEERYRSVVHAEPECVTIVSADGRILEINPAGVKMIEAESASEVLEKSIYSFVDAEDVEQFRSLHQAALEGVYGRLSYRVVGLKGARRWMERQVVPLKDIDGNIDSILGVTRDITDQREAEEALRQSEERFRVIFNLQFQFMALLSPEGIVEEVNDLPLLIGGVRREDVVGKLFWDTVWWKGLPKMQEGWPLRLEVASKALGPVLSEDEYLTGDGTLRTATAAITAVKNPAGNLRHFIVQASDVTARREAEEKARRLAESLQAVIESITDAFYTIDRSWRFTYVNKEAELLLQRNASDLVGRNMFEVFPETSGSRFEGEYRVAMEENTPRIWEEFFAPVKRWVEIRAYPSNEGVAVYLQDITARRKAEDQLQTSNRDLESFAYIVSHDLKAPLRGIAGHAGLLAANYKDCLDEEGGAYIQHVFDGATHMTALINDLLAFSKIQQSDSTFADVPLDTALKRALHMVKTDLDAAGARVVHGKLPVVWGGMILISQLFQNLIANSIKFRGTETPVITIMTEESEGEWVVRVSDNGIGIDPKFHDRIFEVFRRVHVKGYSGTGIGLAICKRIVERHQGRIWVESRAGCGAAFCFTLRSGVFGK